MSTLLLSKNIIHEKFGALGVHSKITEFHFASILDMQETQKVTCITKLCCKRITESLFSVGSKSSQSSAVAKDQQQLMPGSSMIQKFCFGVQALDQAKLGACLSDDG